ncbi:substrate-binding periplasmic protein [Vreelandella olivaria]|uniref:substrate-binding periplasmic protein n=1 Tax=Vreelandella olivaria TaxID=390919 RepID=UPI00201E9D1C|nr:transporter substrate-binding domain-containing protein [Halomonas olivaria]
MVKGSPGRHSQRLSSMVATVLISGQISAAAWAQIPPLTINTEEYPPFNYRDSHGAVAGTATQLLRSALSQAGIEARFRVLPWARAYTEATLRDYHCVYSTTRTEAREALFHWVGPLVVNEWSVFGLAERQLKLTDLNDLRYWRVGSFRADAVGDYVANQGIEVLRAPSERENIARLEAGFLDVIVTGKATGEFIAKEQNIALQHLLTFFYAPLYLACHPSVPREMIERIQTHLDAQLAAEAMP